MLCAVGGHAAPKAAAPTVAATATGAPSTAVPPATGGAAPSPSAAPSAAPDASQLPAPPADVAAPATDSVTPDAEGDAAAEAREAELKRRRRLRLLRIREEEEEERALEERARARRPSRPRDEEPAQQPAESWQIVGSHFMLGVERVTNVQSWSLNGSAQGSEAERTGTDVSFLASGNSGNVFGIPRVAFDGMFSNGLTLGGSLSYLVTSGKTESKINGTSRGSVDSPTVSIFVLAPRIGVVIPASETVGVWLRGGISRIVSSTESGSTSTPNTGTASNGVETTTTLVDFTLDPQLLICPVPHVGLTLGAVFDIGVSGSVDTDTSDVSTDLKASSYGVTAGLAAMF